MEVDVWVAVHDGGAVLGGLRPGVQGEVVLGGSLLLLLLLALLLLHLALHLRHGHALGAGAPQGVGGVICQVIVHLVCRSGILCQTRAGQERILLEHCQTFPLQKVGSD